MKPTTNGALTLWVTQREHQDQLYAITGRTEELEPFGARRGPYSVLEERTSVETSLTISFRDADHVWVPSRLPSRKAALTHFDETAAIAARLVFDREYPAVFAVSATELDGRNYSVLSGYAAVASIVAAAGAKGRSGVVLIQGAVSSGHVVNSLTIAVGVAASGFIGRAKTFVGTQEDDILAHVGDQRVGEETVGRDVLARIATNELLQIAAKLSPYPNERELFGRPIRLWTRDIAFALFAASVCIGAAATYLYFHALVLRSEAQEREQQAQEIAQQARRLVDKASWAASQRQSIDALTVLDEASNLWRPLTHVRVEADRTHTTLSVVAAKAIDVLGQMKENPILRDAGQLASLFSPPSELSIQSQNTSTTSDFNEIVTTYRFATPFRLNRTPRR